MNESSMGALLVTVVGVRAASVHQAGRPPFSRFTREPSDGGPFGCATHRPFAPRWPAVMPAAGRAGPAVPPAATRAAGWRRVFSSLSLGTHHGRYGARLARADVEQTQGRI